MDKNFTILICTFIISVCSCIAYCVYISQVNKSEVESIIDNLSNSYRNCKFNSGLNDECIKYLEQIDTIIKSKYNNKQVEVIP